jgi:hypothetical protein
MALGSWNHTTRLTGRATGHLRQEGHISEMSHLSSKAQRHLWLLTCGHDLSMSPRRC